MSKAMPKEEAGEVATALERFNQKWGPMLGGNASNSTITLTGVAGWQLTACLLMTAMSALLAFGATLFALDARNEMRSNNTNRERDIGELRQTDNAIRAYINSGVLKPKGAK